VAQRLVWEQQRQREREETERRISLETPIGEEEDSHLGDFIEDKTIQNPAEAVININLREITEEVLKTLTPREEKVIKMRFRYRVGLSQRKKASEVVKRGGYNASSKIHKRGNRPTGASNL
jgi:DNA-directed RNA polymerase sigma subunit (sigma70/sigma32)